MSKFKLAGWLLLLVALAIIVLIPIFCAGDGGSQDLSDDGRGDFADRFLMGPEHKSFLFWWRPNPEKLQLQPDSYYTF